MPDTLQTLLRPQKRKDTHMARPKKPDTRNYIYRVRLNEGENQQLMEASEWLNQSKSEVFRKALFDYHAKVKENKCLPESGTDLSEWVFDHISLHRVLTCQYENCGDDFAKDLSPYCEEQSSEAQMGYRCEHFFDTNEIECPSCGRLIHISGVISEYPLGAYEYEQISVEKEA